jgi:hypothetical protein
VKFSTSAQDENATQSLWMAFFLARWVPSTPN